MNMEQAKEVLEKTREIFSRYNKTLGKKEGLKSSNKKYIKDDLAVDWIEDGTFKARVDRRNANVEKASKAIFAGDFKSYSEVAKKTMATRMILRAGNCIQMSCVSASFAMDASQGSSRAYIAKLTSFDHAFCVVLNPPYPTGVLEFKSLIEFSSKSTDSGGVIVIDPWLNLVSMASDYLSSVERKLDKWTSYGKRILVVGTDNRESWVAPNGGYKEWFINSGVRLVEFN